MFMGGSRLSVCVCVCTHVHASLGAHFAVNVPPDPRAFSSFQKPQHTIGTFKGKAVLGSSRDFKGPFSSVTLSVLQKRKERGKWINVISDREQGRPP